MSIKIVDISAKLRAYLLSKSQITALVGTRIFASKFPTNKDDDYEPDNEVNPKLMFRQTGGNPASSADYRYTFIVRSDTSIIARQVAVIVANQLIEENFSLTDDNGNNIAYWAELDSSMTDGIDDITNEPEVFFNINFTSIE